MSRTYRKIFLESYDKVRQIEQQEKDHEISMARSELEAISDKALRLSSLLQGRTEEGNPLEAWVQSKITKAKDYINSALDYMQYTPDLAKESVNEDMKIDEVKMSDIFKMQQDGKTAEDIAKELGLSALFVKRILGEDREWATSPIAKTLEEALSDTQIAMLKKEYDPLKGKTITSAQYQQLKNLLYKLQDGDLEKLQKQNIPFASSGAATALRVRKAKFKITKVTVPGLEGMAEEKIKESHYSMGQHVIFKGPKNPITPIKAQIIQVTEPQVGAYYKIKKADGEITYAAPNQLELDEEIQLQEKPSIKQFVVFNTKSGPKHKEFLAYDEKEIKKQIDDFLKQNPGSMVLKQEPIVSIKENGANKFMVKQKIMKPISDYLKQKEQEKKTEPKKEGILGAVAGGVLGSAAGIPGAVAGAYLGHKIQQAAKKKKNEGAKLTFESIQAVKNKAEKSGMPYNILKQVYDRGMAAWKSGHRPGAGQQQWALARVNSFITKSSGTWGGADKDLAKKVRGS